MKKIPTYEYECTECNEVFSEQRSLSDESKYSNCPKDNSPLQRRYNISIAFKGSGFYTNDKKKQNGE
jgi:putative FmdB family regulatory protein